MELLLSCNWKDIPFPRWIQLSLLGGAAWFSYFVGEGHSDAPRFHQAGRELALSGAPRNRGGVERGSRADYLELNL